MRETLPASTIDAIRAELERRFRTAESTVDTSAGRFELLHPANADDLISEDDYVADERLPYWADVWPSSTVLAGRVAGMHGAAHRALELGCGVGLVAAAAARAGFSVTATDYYADALLFALVNSWRNAGREIATRHVDWRDFPPDLGTFDLVLASDVLYERTYGALVAAAFARTLGPSGRGLVADPGRVAAGAFVEACAALGLEARVAERVAFVAEPIRQTIAIYHVGWAATGR